MKTIRELLATKGNEIWALRPGDTVYQAIELMALKGIGALMVIEDGEVVGVLSERDYARKVILKGKSSTGTTIADIMTSDVVFADAGDSVETCMARMTRKRIRHLPVLDGGELVGVISIGDLVQSVISEQQFLIEQLENYVSGGA